MLIWVADTHVCIQGWVWTPVCASPGMGVVPEGLDMAVRLMTPEEVSTVRAQPAYAYDGRADRPPVT